MTTITPVRFPNKDGLMLYGILHEPAAEKRKDIGILLLSPGVKMRIAPHRLYNKWAEKFVQLGFTVFRFDFCGLGDAEGEIEQDFLADLYGSIQLGRYVEDTRSAMQWLSSACGLDRYILAGLCGGAITGLLTAKSDARVEGLLGLGIPVILDGSNLDKSKYLTEGQMDRLAGRYVRKLLNPVSWWQLLTFQSDYRVIWRIFKKKFNLNVGPALSDGEKACEQKDNTNPLFARAFFEMVSSGRRIIFIFSGSDRLDWEYEEKFVQWNKDKLKQYDAHFETAIIPDANHILSLPEWQEQMMDLSEHWLKKHF